MTNPKKKRTTRSTLKAENKKVSKRARRGSKTSIPPSVLIKYPEDKWVLQWKNNEGGEIERVLSDYRGSKVCEGVGVGGVWSPNGTSVSTSDVVSRPAGRGRNLPSIDMMLMAIPRKEWEEEQEARKADKSEIVNALRQGQDQSGAASVTGGGTYAPDLGNGQFGYSEESVGLDKV